MSQNNSRKYLILSIVLILLACILFEYRTAEFGLTAPGLIGGIFVLTIVGIVLLYRTFHIGQKICLERGLIESRVKSQYDLLFPVALVAVAVHGVWRGDLIEGKEGEEGRQGR